MMQDDNLPLVDAIEDVRFQDTIDEHQVDFGTDDDAVYTPAITLWALISQVFFSLNNVGAKRPFCALPR